ncbi:hypothetical protein FSP39_018401 [Pinctada imbricata]|uniref:Chloride channel CLIC-like protein 1 n=1 Tax=Pinctada imbricata TaxID=66713 RepID=A0AA88Y875_PINIB|nr:hypothetical protein FSP39_018401 [Pinctada imbricata]
MKWFLIHVAVFLILFPHISTLPDDDGDDYIDPFDMTSDMKPKPKNPSLGKSDPPPGDKQDMHDSTTTTTTTAETTTKSPPSPADSQPDTSILKEAETVGYILTKKHIGTLLKHLEGRYPTGHSQEYSMLIKLSKDDIYVLSRFVWENKGSLHDVHEILSSMTLSVTESHLGTFGKVSLWFEDRFGTSIDAALKMLIIMLCASIFTVLEMRLQISWRQRFVKLIVLAFIVSIPMTWYELYKAAEIEQQTVAMKDVPPDCVKDNAEENWFDTTLLAFKSLVTFEKDKCQKYYEHVLIDPFLKVPPTKAVAVTFVRFFVSPLKDVGTSLSQFIRALLIDLPLTLYPVALALVTVFFFLLLFMWFGYSIRLPFFLSIEPTPGYGALGGGDATQVNKAIEENTKKMIEQIQAIQEDMHERNISMQEKISNMEKLQRFALEHTHATPTDDVRAPTLQYAILPTAKSKSSPEIVRKRREENVLENSFESSSSVERTEVKAPIPCSDYSETDGEETKVLTVPSNSAHGLSRQSPDRKSKLPLSLQRSSSKEKGSSTSGTSSNHIVQDSGDNMTVHRSISQPETLGPDSSQGQRGGTFYKM